MMRSRPYSTSLLFLLVLSALSTPAALRANPTEGRSPEAAFLSENSFSSGFEMFYRGPQWFLRALSFSSGVRHPAPMLDRSGDRVEAGYVVTSPEIFDVNLFGNVATTFTSPSTAKTPARLSQAVSTVYTWNSAATATSWLNAANWTGNPGHYPGVDANALSTADGASDDTAAIGVTSATNGGVIGINFGNSSSTGVTSATGASGSLTVGGIDLLATANQSVVIGGSNTATGTLTLTGVTLNGIANTIIANEGIRTLTLQPNVSGSGVMNILLGNSTDNVVQVNGSGAVTISAAISGASRNLSKTGAGILILSGTSSYTGDTTIRGGEILLTASGSLASASTIRLGDTASNTPSAMFTFGDNAGGETIANNLVVQASSSGTEGTRSILGVATNGATNTWSGNVTLQTDLTVQSAASGSTAATGQGTLLFQGGTIDVGDSAFMMNSNLRGNNADTYSIQGIVVVNDNLISTLPTGGSVVKDGSGTLVLGSTNNSYTGSDASNLNNTGGTRIRGGVLGIAGDTSLGLAPSTAATNVYFEASTYNTNLDSIAPTLRADANNIVLAATRNINIASGVTARFDSNGNTFSIAGNINGAGSLAKVGAGTLALTGANTYTGTTTVNNGTLNAAAEDSLGGTSQITVNGGGTLLLSNPGTTDRIADTSDMALNGGTFATGGLSEHGANNNDAGLGALTLQASSIIDLGNGASILALANSALLAPSWNGTLSIYNWSGTTLSGNGTDQLYFGSDATGLTPTQLAQISFYSDSGTTFLGLGSWAADLDGEVVPLAPIPEPSTWLGAALALGAVGFVFRRRLRASRA